MKLGIVVVYLVKEENEALLELHLSQIERHTDVPYTIYASTERLIPKFRERLANNPHVKVCKCRPTAKRNAYEHTHYLEQLVTAALADGVTHIAILHVDSFPVKKGWAVELAARLREGNVLAGITRDRRYDFKANTSCLFFSRGFAEEHRPALLLSATQRTSLKYMRYRREHRVVYDSGIGYHYLLTCRGLRWYPLERSSKGADHYSLGAIYGDMIFHLGSLNLDATACPGDDEQYRSACGAGAALFEIRNMARLLVPPSLRAGIRSRLPKRVQERLFPQRRINAEALATIKQQLLEDPEGYLYYLRTGERLQIELQEAS